MRSTLRLTYSVSAGVKSILSPVMVIGTLTADDMCKPFLLLLEADTLVGAKG